MIQANELRIGNYLYVIGAYPIQVTADHIKSIYEGDKDYKPIPLTPELLEKCGFGITSFDRYENNKYVIVDGGPLGFIFSNEKSFYVIATFKYLHQLQNLYFTLTGEELNIDLTKPKNTPK